MILKFLKDILKEHREIIFLFLFLLIFFLCFLNLVFAGFNCYIDTSCTAGDTELMHLFATDNTHGELISESNYIQKICCGGMGGIGNSCLDPNAVVIGTLSALTNAHFEDNTQSNYSSTYDVCISNTAISPTVAYRNTSCNGGESEFTAMSQTLTNAHLGSSYLNKICLNIPPVISFSISDNEVDFGNLTTGADRYGTGTAGSGGSASETVAHTLTAVTNAVSGYVITVQGETLTFGSDTITAIGETADDPTPGTKQFGLRITASGGSGSVSAPYNDASKYAYGADGNTNDEIASTITGDGIGTVYSIRYLGNISVITEAGNYGATLIYIMTSTF